MTDDDEWTPPNARPTVPSLPRVGDRARSVLAAEQEQRSRRLSTEAVQDHPTRQAMRRASAEHRAKMLLEEQPSRARLALVPREESERRLRVVHRAVHRHASLVLAGVALVTGGLVWAFAALVRWAL